MICPKCETEYVEGIKVCPDCGMELVTKEDFEGHLVHPSDYVVIYTTDNNAEANMLRANLESADIEAHILGQKDSSFPAVGDLAVIKILVKKDDVEDALKIIEDINKHGNESEEEE
jgi:ssDNA-binding Zn-finger/Zn-ribbon topoisomerase 1